MHWQELTKLIENKKFHGVCMMHGDEEYLKDAAIKKAEKLNVPAGLEDINISRITEDDLGKISRSVSMPPFMAEKRVVVIDSFNKFYASKKQYKSADMTETADKMKDMLEKDYTDACIFFLCRGKVESTNPLYKIFKKKDLIVSYDNVKEPEKAEVLSKLAMERGMDISAPIINFLIRYTGGDLLQLINALDKLQNYKQAAIGAADIEEICHASVDYNVFNMIKAIDAKRKHEALRILKDMLRGGENVYGIISLIERQYRVYAFVDDIKKEFGKSVNFNELEKRLGVKYFAIEKMYKQGMRMDKQKRDRILKMCTDADYLSKKGRINDVAALEKLVINLIAQ